MGVIARSTTTKQSPSFERFEIARSAFGLLAMTTPKINLNRPVELVGIEHCGKSIRESCFPTNTES